MSDSDQGAFGCGCAAGIVFGIVFGIVIAQHIILVWPVLFR